MKHIFLSVIILTLAAGESHAQWKSIGFDNPAAFGVHNDTLFASQTGAGVARYDSGSWVIADNGMQPGSDKITAFGSVSNAFIAATNGLTQGAYRSTDNGSSWSAVRVSFQLNCFITIGNNIYAGGTDFWNSTNGGVNWSASDSGIANYQIYSLAVSGSTLFAGTNGGVFLSTDSGKNWTPTGFTTWTTALAVVGTIVLAGTDQSGIYRSTDGGLHWTAANNGITIGNITSVVAYRNNLFAGSDGHGVFFSIDSGSTWDTVNDGLPALNILTLCVFDTFLVAGIDDGNSFDPGTSYMRLISEMVKKDTSLGVVQQIPQFDSIEIYPNPATGMVTIAGNTPILSIRTLNVLGEELLNYSNTYSSNVTFDLSKFPSGTYFVEIQTAKGTVLRKIIRE